MTHIGWFILLALGSSEDAIEKFPIHEALWLGQLQIMPFPPNDLHGLGFDSAETFHRKSPKQRFEGTLGIADTLFSFEWVRKSENDRWLMQCEGTLREYVEGTDWFRKEILLHDHNPLRFEGKHLEEKQKEALALLNCASAEELQIMEDAAFGTRFVRMNLAPEGGVAPAIEALVYFQEGYVVKKIEFPECGFVNQIQFDSLAVQFKSRHGEPTIRCCVSFTAGDEIFTLAVSSHEGWELGLFEDALMHFSINGQPLSDLVEGNIIKSRYL